MAENIIIERFVSANSADFTISSTETIKSDNIDLIYLFHIDPIGFVLVPADDRAIPVLTYSFESDFITENMPGNLSYMLNLYKSEILGAIETNRSSDDEIIEQAKFISSSFKKSWRL